MAICTSLSAGVEVDAGVEALLGQREIPATVDVSVPRVCRGSSRAKSPPSRSSTATSEHSARVPGASAAGNAPLGARSGLDPPARPVVLACGERARAISGQETMADPAAVRRTKPRASTRRLPAEPPCAPWLNVWVSADTKCLPRPDDL